MVKSTTKRHSCPKCDRTFTQKGNLTYHLARKHKINQVWRKCTQPNCNYKALRKFRLEAHLASRHKINQVWHHCPHCTHTTLQKGNLKKHLARKHKIGQVWHHCPHCTHKSIQKSDLNKHIASIHDIGNIYCDICYETCGKVRHIKAANENVKGADVCRTCCDDYGFRKERIESQYIKGIRKQFDHFMVHDARINGDACLRYRPDAIWLDILCRVHIHFELDEHQHLWKNGSYDCDERRISDIYDEFKDNVPQHYVVVRLNPDGYKGQQTKRSEVFKHRLTHLIEILKRVKVDPPTEKISVIYMYYDRTNHRIAKNLPAYFVDDDTRQY